MSEVKNPTIKLCGKTIQPLYPDEIILGKANRQQRKFFKEVEKSSEETQRDATCSFPSSEELMHPSTSSEINDDPKMPISDEETSSKNTPRIELPIASSNLEEKPQKPDKFLLSLRCKSMDTKFCYLNNYNIKQSRHFFEHCQRYWNAGGTMRNTGVSFHRRKNKISSLAYHYRHIIVSKDLQGAHHHIPFSETNSSDHPLCESMNLATNLSDKSWKSDHDHSISGSTSALNSTKRGLNDDPKNFQGNPLQEPCFPARPWPSMAPPTNLGPSAFPVCFYPTPQYWGCSIRSSPSSMPWVCPPSHHLAPTSVGKHSRDEVLLSPSSRSRNEKFSGDRDSGSGILISKIMRVNNLNEADKNSLHLTQGISKADHSDLFEAFRSEGVEAELGKKALVNLRANPAAMLRSLDFQETS